ncbi:MAG: MFS transporter [Polyangiales bacterium]
MILARIRDRNVVRVYEAVLLIGMAYGISISLTPLHLDALHFDKRAIGTLAAWFAGGIVLFSLPMGPLIKRFSARGTLVASVIGYAACVAVFPHLKTYSAVAIARFLDGAFSVGIWVGTETILLSRADEDNKAFVTSVYAMALAVGYVFGPLVARAVVAVAPTWVAFAASGVLATLAGLYLLARLEADTVHAHAHGSDAAEQSARAGESVLWRIKTSCFATFAYGYFQASVVLFLPLFLIESKGVARERTILVTAFFAAGMLLFSNLFGRLGDRFGHLRVMRVLAMIGTAMILGFVFLDSFWIMCAAVFVAGATLASISPVSLALQGVVAAPSEYGRANAIYNAFYAVGMLLGPPVSSTIFAARGGEAMLLHLGALWVGFIVFASVFAGDDPANRRRPAAAGAEAPETLPATTAGD